MLRPGIRTIDWTTMPVDKMPIAKLKEAVPEDTPMGRMLAELPDESLQAQSSDATPGEELEKTIELLGAPNSDQSDLF